MRQGGQAARWVLAAPVLGPLPLKAAGFAVLYLIWELHADVLHAGWLLLPSGSARRSYF